MRLPLKPLSIALALLLTACRSDPIHYHTLMPTQAPAVSDSSHLDIQIERLSLPPQVDRPQIVVRQGNSGLAVLETEWWGASLADELQSALVDLLPSNGASHKIGLRLDVQRFDSVPGQYALLETKWRLRALTTGDNTPSLSCRSVFRTASGVTIEDLVAAHQHNVQALATLITQAASDGRSTCPSPQ